MPYQPFPHRVDCLKSGNGIAGRHRKNIAHVVKNVGRHNGLPRPENVPCAQAAIPVFVGERKYRHIGDLSVSDQLFQQSAVLAEPARAAPGGQEEQ